MGDLLGVGRRPGDRPERRRLPTQANAAGHGIRETAASSGGQTFDSLANIVAIDDSGEVAPIVLELGKGAESRLQWMNDAHDTMLVVFKGAPIGVLVPPGQYSVAHRVCLTCPDGDYEYSVLRMTKGAPTSVRVPTEPRVRVGG